MADDTIGQIKAYIQKILRLALNVKSGSLRELNDLVGQASKFALYSIMYLLGRAKLRHSRAFYWLIRQQCLFRLERHRYLISPEYRRSLLQWIPCGPHSVKPIRRLVRFSVALNGSCLTKGILAVLAYR